MSRLNPLHYLLLVIAFSWTPWFMAIVTNSTMQSSVGMMCMILGSAGPTLAALFLLKQSTKHQINNYWHRVFDLHRIPIGMGCIIIVLMPLLTTLSTVIATLWGHSPAQFSIVDSIQLKPISILTLTAMILIFGPISEELGWRGYWLDVLGRRNTLFVTSIIIGSTWAIWHAPLFFLPGSSLHKMDINALKLIIFFCAFIPKSIIFTWIYCCTNRSILAAILFHFMLNLTESIIIIDRATEGIQMVLLLAVALGLLFIKRDLFFTPPQKPAERLYLKIPPFTRVMNILKLLRIRLQKGLA